MKRGLLRVVAAWLLAGSAAAARAGERARPPVPVAPLTAPVSPSSAVSAPELASVDAGAAAAAARSAAAPEAPPAGLSWRQVGEAIQGRSPLQSLGEAAARLAGIGALSAPDVADAASLREAVQRLWYNAAPSTPRLFPVDDGWAVPALKVVSGPSTYYVHGIVHAASLNAPSVRRREVRALVRQAKERGEPLISELHFPSAYSFEYGTEVVDAPGGESRRPAFADAVVGVVQGVWRAGQWAAVLLPAAALAVAPDQPGRWALLAAGAGAAYLIHRSFAPLRRAAFLWASLKAGGETGRRLRGWARVVFAPKLDLDALRREQLPVALEPGGAVDHARRARALAEAAAGAARESGKPVHVLTGFRHMDEVAARLAHDQSPSRPGPNERR